MHKGCDFLWMQTFSLSSFYTDWCSENHINMSQYTKQLSNNKKSTQFLAFVSFDCELSCGADCWQRTDSYQVWIPCLWILCLNITLSFQIIISHRKVSFIFKGARVNVQGKKQKTYSSMRPQPVFRKDVRHHVRLSLDETFDCINDQNRSWADSTNEQCYRMCRTVKKISAAVRSLQFCLVVCAFGTQTKNFWQNDVWKDFLMNRIVHLYSG